MPDPNFIGPPEAPLPEAPLPAGYIPVYSPEGEKRIVEIKTLSDPEALQMFKDEGWSLGSDKAAPQITPDLSGEIDVISPQGELRKVKPSVFQDSEAMAMFHQEGWKLGTPDNQTTNQNVNDYIKAIKDPIRYHIDSDLNVKPRDSSLGLLDSAKEQDEEQKTGLSKLTDVNGNYKMLAPNGDTIFVPQDKVMGLLTSGADFKFADPKFQALYDAQLRNQEQSGHLEEASAISGIAKSIPFVSGLQKSMIFDVDSPEALAGNLASTVLKDTKYQKAELYGEIGGTIGQILSPTGLAGEIKAAQAAKAGIVAKLAPEGAGFLRVLGAKALGGLAEGAIITAPQAIAQATIDENPKAAAESIGLGMGIGLILGAGSPLLSKIGEVGLGGIKKGAAAIPPTPA